MPNSFFAFAQYSFAFSGLYSTIFLFSSAKSLSSVGEYDIPSGIKPVATTEPSPKILSTNALRSIAAEIALRKFTLLYGEFLSR